MNILFWCAVLAQLPTPIDGENPRQRTVDASRDQVFGLVWHRPVVGVGFERLVKETLGTPAVSPTRHAAYVATGEGLVLSVDLKSKNELWRFDAELPFEAPLTLASNAWAGDVVLAGALDGTLFAISTHDGSLKWKTKLDGPIRAAPRVEGERIYVATAKNKLYVLYSKDGTLAWTQGRPAPTKLTIDGHARPTVTKDTVILGYSDGYVEAYGVGDGLRKWSRPITLRPTEFRDADADPVVRGDIVYVASYGDGVYALRVDSGQVLWTQAARGVSTLALADGRLVAGSAEGFVWGFEPKTGKVVFRTELARGPVSRLAVQHGLLAFTASDMGLIVLRAKNGEPLQSTSYGVRFSGDPYWKGDHLVALSSGGTLFYFSYQHPGMAE